MKKLLNKGFTMIELLIVIAVLGVLAVAVLSAINPIEQINRGRDTGSRSDAEQLLSAIDRYYTSHEIYPWQTSSDDLDSTRPVDFQVVDNTWTDSGGNSVLSNLSEGGSAELKSSFVNRLNSLASDYKLRVHMRGNEDDSVYVCFRARSGSFKQDALARCTAGLPEDLQDIQDTVCDETTPYVCLP